MESYLLVADFSCSLLELAACPSLLEMDKLSELLLERGLRESKPGDEVRNVARVRTLTVLPRLNDDRKRSMLKFLQELRLIEKQTYIINLLGVNLSKSNLSGINLMSTILM